MARRSGAFRTRSILQARTGRLTLQLLGAVAEFERSLIRERTVVGLKYAKSQGIVLGNPRIKARDPAVLAKIKAGRHRTQLSKVTQTRTSGCPWSGNFAPRKPGRWFLLPLMTRYLSAGDYSLKNAWFAP